MNDKYEMGETTTFLDVLMSMLLFLSILFILAITMVNVSQVEHAVETKAEYIITVTWPNENEVDIDTHVQDPSGRRVWFSDTNNGLMHLDRDDVGAEPDSGGQFKYSDNREIVTLRGINVGEYIVNLHGYRMYSYNPIKQYENVPVHVTIQKVNPSVVLVFESEVVIEKGGSEVTVIRFELDKDGNIKSTSKLPYKMVRGIPPTLRQT